MAKNEVYRKKLDENGQPLVIDGDFVMELIHSEDVPDIEDESPVLTGNALQAVMAATPEEIEQIKQLLGIK